MNNWRYKMYQFMQGRRGLDQFSHFLMAASAIIFLISILFYWGPLYYAGVVMCIFSMFRCFSKNIYKREKENNWFLALKYKVTGGRTFGRRGGQGAGYRNGQNIRYDMEHYVYFVCPACGQKLRAPRGRGKIKITCQNCRNTFEKRV